MAAIQLAVSGHGNVPDEAVALLRARVSALVAEATRIGLPLRIDFSPAADPVPLSTTGTGTTQSAPVVAATPPVEAAVLDRPQPRGRRVPLADLSTDPPAAPAATEAP